MKVHVRGTDGDESERPRRQGRDRGRESDKSGNLKEDVVMKWKGWREKERRKKLDKAAEIRVLPLKPAVEVV